MKDVAQVIFKEIKKVFKVISSVLLTTCASLSKVAKTKLRKALIKAKQKTIAFFKNYFGFLFKRPATILEIKPKSSIYTASKSSTLSFIAESIQPRAPSH